MANKVVYNFAFQSACQLQSLAEQWDMEVCTWRKARLGGGAIVHRPSDTFDTCWLRNWHRHWLVVWSCPGSTTAMLCSTALPATASRSCSEYRTTQLQSFSKHQDDPTLARCWGRYTGCPFSRGSTTKCSADIQSPQHLYTFVPATPNPGSRTVFKLWSRDLCGYDLGICRYKEVWQPLHWGTSHLAS